MSEIKLQSEIVQEISARFPFLRGRFFHVSNERNNKVQAYQARSIGIFPGVSDFLYFEEKTAHGFVLENCCKLIALEVKEPNSYHKLDHLKQQAEWGQILENAGGKYVIVTSVLGAVEVIEGNFEHVISLQEFQEMIKSCKVKSMKF